MANYKRFIVLAAIVILIIVGIPNYVPESPSGYATRYDVTEWTCEWDNGWHWTGEAKGNTWKLEQQITSTEGYCTHGIWYCENDYCDAANEGTVCICLR